MNTAAMTRRQALIATLGLATPLLGMAATDAAGLPRALTQPALKVARPTKAVLQAIVRAGPRLVAAGERGLVIYSDDAGQSWHQADVPVSCTLTALCFADARRGWAVGNLGTVLTTDDGGTRWRKCLDGAAAAELALLAARQAPEGSALQDDAQRLVDEGPDKPLLGIAMRADGSLLAVGAYGLALSSTDDGRSWQSQMHRLPNPDGLSLYGTVEQQGQRMLYGEQGLLLQSNGRNGADFSAATSPSQGSLFGALSLREGPVLLLGLRGKAWRRTDLDAPWTAMTTPVDAALIAGTQLSDDRVLLVGSAGQLLQSRDGGHSFQSLALRQRFPFAGLAQAPDGSVLLVGMRGLLRLGVDELQAADRAATPSPTA